MKIQKSAEHYYDAAFDEIKILEKIRNEKDLIFGKDNTDANDYCVCQLLD